MPDTHLKQLTCLVREALEKGFVLDDDAIHFLQSTYAVSGFEDLRSLVVDGDENDTETILDLVVSPDREFMRVAEPSLSGHDFTDEDVIHLIRGVSSKPIFTRISYPGTTNPVECGVPEDLIIRFVKKLRITFPFPESLMTTMQTHITEQALHSARVLIRHSGLELDDQRLDFFSLFFKYGGPGEEILLSDLEWVLSVLPGQRTTKSIQDTLMDCLHEYQKRMEEIKTIEDMLAQNTMETLMLQSVRVPSISRETLRGRMVTVRRILATVYGWVEQQQPAPSSVDLGDCVGQEGIEKIVKLLS